ncbi:hypothetical protein [Chondrinema litorale]|uniref:hypothetical protein n=1 Tax=Chondrinema litorale TaxID=2994555 RepID=UPI002542EE01|nr:hypothetical protein [Chondrinema litorale]UZR97104.1 hypothetical protein OQ292_23685 [Chondrinema litorale]
MEMDLGTAIIGIFGTFLCILPFILIAKSRKNRAKQLLNSLTKIANEHHCQINQKETFGNFAIGLDELKNTVFFYREAKDKVDEQYINLADFQSCKVINTNRTFKSNSGMQKVIDKLELDFIPKTREKQDIKLEFFNADVSLQLYEELQGVEKWSKILNDRLVKK